MHCETYSKRIFSVFLAAALIVMGIPLLLAQAGAKAPTAKAPAASTQAKTPPATPAKSTPATQAKTAAPAPAPPQFLSVGVTRVKPEMITEYQNIIKNDVNPAYQKAGIAMRNVWTTAAFGPSGEYVTVSPIANFAQYDQPTPLVRALGQDGANQVLQKIRKCVDSSRTYAVRVIPELSIMGEMTAPPKFAVVTMVKVMPGKTSEFETFIKTDILPALKKLNYTGYFVHQTIFGGDANEYVTVALLDSFADLDKGSPLRRAHGVEGEKRILQRAGAIVTSVERVFSRYVPDMSYNAPPSSK